MKSGACLASYFAACLDKKGSVCLNIWLDLFWSFFCIGGLTFGGGYAMLPMLEREIVDRRHWTTSEEVLDYYAVGQCTPGVIAVNVATFVGFRQKGYLGAMVSTIGLVTPSFIVIAAIAGILKKVEGMAMVTHAFGGIRVAVCALILAAVIKLFKSSVKDKLSIFIFAATFFVMLLLNLSPIIIVIAAGAIGFFSKSGFKKEDKA